MSEFKYVPVEPTDEMLEAVCNVYMKASDDSESCWVKSYKAAVLAAPTQTLFPEFNESAHNAAIDLVIEEYMQCSKGTPGRNMLSFPQRARLLKLQTLSPRNSENHTISFQESTQGGEWETKRKEFIRISGFISESGRDERASFVDSVARAAQELIHSKSDCSKNNPTQPDQPSDSRTEFSDTEIPSLTTDRIADIVREHLTAVYSCTRVWSAWSYGTMGQDDFVEASETELAEEIAEAIKASMKAQEGS